jgi:hypothetical protein
VGSLTGGVLADVAAPTVPIGAEFWGLARDVRRRIEREDADYNALVNRLLDPVIERLRRHPHRPPGSHGEAGQMPCQPA